MFMLIAATGMIMIFMYIFSNLYMDNYREKENLLFEDYGASLQNEFILAAEARPGYFREFEVPEKLEGYSFNVSIINSFLIINTTGKSFDYPLPEMEGNMTRGTNYLRKTEEGICLNC